MPSMARDPFETIAQRQVREERRRKAIDLLNMLLPLHAASQVSPERARIAATQLLQRKADFDGCCLSLAVDQQLAQHLTDMARRMLNADVNVIRDFPAYHELLTRLRDQLLSGLAQG